MFKGFHFINSVNRHTCRQCLRSSHSTRGICKFTQQHVTPVRSFQQPSSPSSTLLADSVDRNNKKLFTLGALGIASGIGVGYSSWTRLGKQFTHHNAITNEPSDPTTIESGWLPSTEELNAQFVARVNSGELIQIRTTKEFRDSELFTTSHPVRGAHFEYALFYRESDERGFAVVQFGPKTRGGPGYVHGGASATIFDSMSGVFMSKGVKTPAVTLNLNINYRGALPLNTPVLVEIWIEKIEGRKNYVRCELKSADGKKIYVEGVGLWLTFNTKPTSSL